MAKLNILAHITSRPKRRIYLLLGLWLCAIPICSVLFAVIHEPNQDGTFWDRLGRWVWFTVQTVTFSTLGDVVPTTFEGRLVAIFLKYINLFCLGGAIYYALQASLLERMDKITEARIRQIKEKPINIFLCHRKADSAGHTGRIFDRLSAFFGPEHVFMNIDTPVTSQEPVNVQKTISDCHILIAVIGHNWTGKEPKHSLIFKDDDAVYLELKYAMQKNIPIIPVLINGAPMPSVSEITGDLAGILRIQAHELSDARWNTDVQRLIDLIDTMRKRL